MAQLGDSVAVYLDGGPCPGDVPSTIVDLTGTVPRLLRQGVIPADRLREVILLNDVEEAAPARPRGRRWGRDRRGGGCRRGRRRGCPDGAVPGTPASRAGAGGDAAGDPRARRRPARKMPLTRENIPAGPPPGKYGRDGWLCGLPSGKCSKVDP